MKILLVDDSPTILMSLTGILERHGIEHRTAPDGAEALAILDRETGFDLVITDLNMPGMDGIELVEAIRCRDALRFVPILMLTTESARDKRTLAREAGATGWLVKPVDPAALVKVIRQVVARV